MSLASKIQQIYNGCADIRLAIKEEDSTKGRGLIGTLGDQIRALFARKFITLWTKTDITEDDGEGNQVVTGTTYNQGKYYISSNRIPDAAFNGRTDLVSVILPETVLHIGPATTSGYDYEQFKGCTNLEYINLHHVLTITKSAFEGCTSLKHIETKNLSFIGGAAFRGCTSLETIKLGGTLGTLTSLYSNYTFGNCTSLKSVELSPTITTIQRGAFYGCSNLETINTRNIKVFEQDTFYGCYKLGGVDLSEATSFGLHSLASLRGPEYTLGNKVISIGQTAFCHESSTGTARNSLSGVINCPNLNTIGRAAFSRTKITEIQDLGNITSIPDEGGYSTGCFAKCYDLTNVHLPETLTSIGSHAFQSCTALQEVTIDGEQLISVRDYSFSGCTSLVFENFPWDRLGGYLGNYAFQNCTGLVYDGVLDLPNITSVGTHLAFSGCTGLTGELKLDSIVNGPGEMTNGVDFAANSGIRFKSMSFMGAQGNFGPATSNRSTFNSYLQKITIGPGITSVGQRCFQGCSSLNTVVLYSETPPTISTITFSGCHADLKFYVPYSSDHSILEAYKVATNWSSLASKIYELDQDGNIPE